MRTIRKKSFIMLVLILGFSLQAIAQVPGGYTIVKTHNEDITWYEVKDEYGGLEAVYNNKVISNCKDYWSSVSYSHGYFFFKKADFYFVFDKYGNKVMNFEGTNLIDCYEDMGKHLYMKKSYNVYDENCNKIEKIHAESFKKTQDDLFVVTLNEKIKYGLYNLSKDSKVLDEQFNGISFYNNYGEDFIKVRLFDGDTKYGLYCMSGNEIIAPEFEDCGYMGNDLFKFKMNGYWGVMNRQGKIIIPLSRQYTQIDYSRTLNTFTFVKEGGYKGECNAKGVQTSIVKVQTQKPQQKAEQPTTPKQTTSTPASSGVTSSSNTTSSSKKEDGLLYEGDYTQGNAVSQSSGRSIPPAMIHHHVKIYEDHLEDMGRWDYEGMSGGYRVYSMQVGWNPPVTVKYFVDGSFNITEYRPVGGMNGVETFVSRFSKGNVVYNMNEPTQGGYDNSNSGYGTTKQKPRYEWHEVTEDCYMCHGSGKCSSCNGTHSIWYQFGGGKIECPNCRPDGRCTTCGGRGKITKQKLY